MTMFTLTAENVRHLQSGGFADVFLETHTNVCFKIFRHRGAEKKEFNVIKYLRCKNEEYLEDDEENDLECSKQSRLVKYLNSGYVEKEKVFETYRAAFPNEPSRVADMMKNYEEESEVAFISMEYIEGVDGLDFGLKFGFLDEHIAMDLALSLLLAVQEIHDLGLLHRDIKPDNFIVVRNKETGKYDLKLIDLGLAIKKPIHHSQSIFEAKIGTKEYLAPESFNGWHSESSDLYSVGMTFIVLCGSKLEKSSYFTRLLMRLTSTNPILRGSIDEAIERVRDIQRRFKCTSPHSVVSTSLSPLSSSMNPNALNRFDSKTDNESELSDVLSSLNLAVGHSQRSIGSHIDSNSVDLNSDVCVSEGVSNAIVSPFHVVSNSSKGLLGLFSRDNKRFFVK